MAYYDHFTLADDVINHLDSLISNADSFIASKYVGFVSISAVTVYELAIKEIFIEFGKKKHKVLGNFTSSFFIRINGRIKTRTIQNEYIKRFGDKYVKRFKTKKEKAEKKSLREDRISILSSYSNIIEWRNQFAHEGKVPIYVTYAEVKQSYSAGKKLIDCLAETMVR